MRILSAIALLLLFMLTANQGYTQFTVVENNSAVALAKKIVGPGVTILNAQIKGTANSSGFFTDRTNTLGIDSGIVLSSGRVKTTGGQAGVDGSASSHASTTLNIPGDNDLNNAANVNTLDATVLEFDFIPQGDSINVKFVFGSEEYAGISSAGFACTQFNDAFAFLISGPGIAGIKNIALVPGTTIPVAINSINNGVPGQGGNISICNNLGSGSPFTSLYKDNRNGTVVTYNGLTVVLKAEAKVTPCQTYHIKLAIGDVIDRSYDSGVFIEANSFRSNAVTLNSEGSFSVNNNNVVVEGCKSATVKLSRNPNNASNPFTANLSYAGTAVSGVDYQTLPSTISFAAGETEKTLEIVPIPDNTTEGDETLKMYLFTGNCTLAASDSITFIIKDTIMFRYTSDSIVCSEIPKALNASSVDTTTNTYLWSTGATTQSIQTNLAGTYTVLHTFSQTCSNFSTFNLINGDPVVNLGPDKTICNTDSALLDAKNLSSTYTWSTAETTSSINVKQAGTYWVTVTKNNGCYKTDTINIYHFPIPPAVINGTDSLCEGATLALSATPVSGATYSWTSTTGFTSANSAISIPNTVLANSGRYILEVKKNGCSGFDTAFVLIKPYPGANISGSTTYCERDTISLKTDTVAGATYKWLSNTGYTSNTQHLLLPNVKTNQSATYTVQVNLNGCVSSASANVLVKPIAKINLGKDTTFCAYDEIVLNAAYPSTTYEWSTGSTASSIVVNTPGIYWVKATYGGCTSTESIALDYKIMPIAKAGNDQTILLGGTARINAVKSSVNSSYFWTPSQSLDRADISNPKATPTADQRYVLTVTSVEGCVLKDTLDVFVDTKLAIPNSFSPNGDGINDKWIIPHFESIINARVEIYNRSGMMVYSSTGYDNPFDGTYNGKPLPVGTYYYIIRPYSNIYPLQQGSLTILR